MYILFINSGGRRDIFFLLNLIIIVIKKINQPIWVGLDLCDGLGWVEFFLTHYGGLGQKIPLTRPMHTPRSNAKVALIERHMVGSQVLSHEVFAFIYIYIYI